MVEVPGQYALTADSSAEPLVDTHALIERLSASVSVRRNPATGVTSRTVSIRADDGKLHQFIMRRDAPALDDVDGIRRMIHGARRIQARQGTRTASRCKASASTIAISKSALVIAIFGCLC